MELAPFRKIGDPRPGLLQPVQTQMELAPFEETANSDFDSLTADQVRFASWICRAGVLFGVLLHDLTKLRQGRADNLRGLVA